MLEVCSLMKNDGVHKEWRFLGRRFFSCLDRFSTLKNIMYDLSLRNRFVLEHHPKSFAPYRCYCKGRDLVLVATGQTLARYRFKSDAVHVGVNRAFMAPNISALDFYFIQDISGARDYIEAANEYRSGECVKFYGRLDNPKCAIPLRDVESAKAFQYLTMAPYDFKSFNVADLTTSELPDFGSVVFSALAFSLWMRPTRLYLVGCDCSSSYFDDTQAKRSFEFLIHGWRVMSEYAKVFYPDVEIVSVNPVGLKGLFKDSYE